MKNEQKGCGCTSSVIVAMIGLIGVILTGIFGLAGAILGREDIPIPFLSALNPSGNPPTSVPAPPTSDTSSQGNGTGNTVTFPDTPTPPPLETVARFHMILDGYTVDSMTGASAGYRVEIDTEGVVGSTRSTFTGLSTTTLQDVFGQLYYRQAYVEGEFNSGVLSLYDTNILSEDSLPSGSQWCYMSVYAPATDAQGTNFGGSYESTIPPCQGQINLTVVSQTQVP